MLLKDFTSPLVRSPSVSEQRFGMRIASGQCIVRGTMFTSWMPRLENAGTHIDRQGMPFSIWTLTQNMLPHFVTSLTMILEWQEILQMSIDLGSSWICYPGFG